MKVGKTHMNKKNQEESLNALATHPVMIYIADLFEKHQDKIPDEAKREVAIFLKNINTANSANKTNGINGAPENPFQSIIDNAIKKQEDNNKK